MRRIVISLPLAAVASLLIPVLASAQQVQPANVTLVAGEQKQFSLMQNGVSEPATWTSSPNGLGAITAKGLYTAPSAVNGSIAIHILAYYNGTPYTTKVYLVPGSSGFGSPSSGSPGSPIGSPSTSTTPVVTAGSTAGLQSGSGSGSSSSSIAVSVSPGSITLSPGQRERFKATVTGTFSTGVIWSMSPQVGIMSNGIYTAPSSISVPSAVTVTAASAADATQFATAVVYLQPNQPTTTSVSITLSPTSVSLQGGQSKQFSPAVSGTTNKGVTWSLVPNVGTISNGLYSSPGAISSAQTVSVIATSTADTTKSASAAVQLRPLAPTVAVSVTPPATSLVGGGSIQFSASVTGTSNTAVSWSLSPSVGTVNNGLYTAPATVSAQQNVTIIATSAADSTKKGQATITLSPPTPTTGATTVTLPLEVVGLNGKTVSATVNIPQGSNLGGQQRLWMQIHGVRFETQASVQINGKSWMPISTSTVTLSGNAAAYGGIGGGFSTLKMTMNLPARTLTAGNNTITFRFNQTDGRVSGFRVLNFNFLDTNGNQILPSSTFVEDDPNSWQPPSTAASDIAAGKNLWYTANLTAPTASGTIAIRAHCTDCHAQDGRDLKYFNYSNNSIETRAMFHGLTAQQGAQIASYIRTLNVVNPGRPWNPPYQPGPGLDEQPASDWAAGAGVDAVLDNDQELLQAMFPNGIQQSVFDPTANLNQRELPIPFELPDWNQWLPGTSPQDALPGFTSTVAYQMYQTARAGLKVSDPVSYKNQSQNIWLLPYQLSFFVKPQLGLPSSSNWTPKQVDEVYSLGEWGMVKTWELMNEFQLQGLGQSVFGPQAESRTWFSHMAFYTAPHMLDIPAGIPGLRNGSHAVWDYLSYVWYHTQLIINDSNRRDASNDPIDWGYAMGFVGSMSGYVKPQAALYYLWLIKALQISNNGLGPNVSFTGFNWANPKMSLQVRPDWQGIWMGVPASTRAALENGIVQAYLQVVKQFTPQQWYAGGWANPSIPPQTTYQAVTGANDFGTDLWFDIPQYKYYGLDQSLVDQWAAWARTVWPANWNALTTATCVVTSSGVQCSTEH